MSNQRPLRAVVLDNDETTGSYAIVFVILEILQRLTDVTEEYVKSILDRLAVWMYKFGLFRPGLRKLLFTLTHMRNKGMIDSIVMYTNQTEIEHTISLLWSPPKCIAYMMNKMVEESVFNHILAREVSSKKNTIEILKKKFTRVLDLHPSFPKNICEMVFVDDLASPDFILANDIPEDAKNNSAWYKIPPYRRILTWQVFYGCLKYCFQNKDFVNDVYFKSYSKYKTLCPKEATTIEEFDDEPPLEELSKFIISKYIMEPV
jgi:hypothetical protein